MADATLVDRLAALPNMDRIPRPELEWLADHGHIDTKEAGALVAPKGQPIEWLWVMMSGRMVVRVDRGTGARIVTEWHAGDVSGMLPYSRMKAPPGDNVIEERSEALAVHESHFPEMIRECPAFTAYTVHSMLDRARQFRASDLQDEKLASLGRLAAGLAHELNNPASAVLRGAKQLSTSLAESDEASRALGEARLDEDAMGVIERVRSACAVEASGSVRSPLEQAEREEAFYDWLDGRGLDPGQADALAATVVTIDAIDTLADSLSPGDLDVAVRWIAAGCASRSLALDIEQAAGRISDLVSAIKRFTYMDQQGSEAPVDLDQGLRDTVRIVASKARARSATLDLDIEPGLPEVVATGGELNQVWLNLVDNALDAIDDGGQVAVQARTEGGRVVVRIIDDGGGIPEEIRNRVFDPFFTTKPPGQGTGLGLDITRRLLARNGGEITIESRPGRTEFRVSLPVAKDDERAD